ncbi:MAG: hypothetical protein H7Y18_00885 [Clostridiaceae bacterium]|nr:hypothetical protein [Clostridiaceae bacterium]
MGEISYRSIFPNNNIPSEEFQFKSITLKERLMEEISSLIDRVDFTEISSRILQLEFKIKVEQDPINTLLQQLEEKSKINNEVNT